MPSRPAIPSDDLYARLGVPFDASPEAIEVAWRGLLRRHHPDVAGPDGLDLAKRINVAHDWLSDPTLRRRYDEDRLGHASAPTPGSRGPAGDVGTSAPWANGTWGGASGRSAAVRRRPPTTAERVAAVVDRVARLDADELDRLALAERAPIAFLATLRRFASPELQEVLDGAERRASAALPGRVRHEPAVSDAIAGKLADVVLGDTIEELLGEPAGARARERLTRGWDAAVGQPRYGPATDAVDEFLGRLAHLSATAMRALARTSPDRTAEMPWPRGTSPDEDEALRVSSELARGDAEAVLETAWRRETPGGPAVPAGARRAAQRIAHLLVLRHAIRPMEFDRLAAPWIGGLVPRGAPWTTRVRHRR